VELTGIGPVKVAATSGVPAGAVDVLIRPERLRPVGQVSGADNVFDVIVEDIINYGDSLIAIGKTHGLPIRARIVGGDPNALASGQTIKLGWAAADAHVLVRS
jgi:ABC-type Fe3+/spermidine/putrescine transport system ATPase subunit